eukprot:m.221659 g.221659  ORF g.221659 m.221659 type:complete len:135 (+) comp15857_c0_seq1:35-439(+)
MALALRRLFSTARTLRAAAKPTTAEFGVTGRIPEDQEQATGLEKKELDEILKGNTDPFGLAGAKIGAFGTREKPRAIPSHFDARIVGCACEEDSEIIRFFEVKAGDAQMCPCSRKQYFKLVHTGAEGLSVGGHH